MLFRLVGFLLRLVLLPLWMPWWALRRRFPAGGWLHVTIDGGVRDYVAPPRFFRFGPQPTSIVGLEKLVTLVSSDARVHGVLFTIRSLRCGMATATALRDVIGKLRAAGKETAVYLPLGGDTKELYVATAAHRILAGPQSTLAPVGFASRTRYVKRTLDKLGVEAQIVSRGAYKSFGETLVRDTMSDEQREQVTRLLDTFYGEVVQAIAKGRNVDEVRAKALIDEAPHRATAAVAAGLIDVACYEDELPARLGNERGGAWFYDAATYLARQTTPLLPSLRRSPVVGVLPVHGTIGGGGPERLAMDERVIQGVRAARADRRVRAVVLHVNSPGGSALASDRIHHELAQLAREKPLIACFSDVAASGGYYVSAPAACVVAQPTTVTGSIGVVGARFAADAMFERLGVRTESITRGARAGLLDPLKPLDDDERAAIDREMGGVYDAFVGVVAEGRKRDRADIERIAGGRVYSGVDAKHVGLVDELGGIALAMSIARTRGGLGPDAPVALLRSSPFGRIPPLAPPAPKTERIASWLGEAFGVDWDLLGLLAGRERVLVLSEIARLFL